MSEKDFIKIGLDDTTDLFLLSNCSKALKSHIQQNHLNDQDSETDFFSIKSSISEEEEDDDDDDSPLMTPSSIINAINAFDSFHTKRTSSPPSIVVIPSLQTNTPSAQDFQHSLKVPGTVTPRPRNNNNNNKQTISSSRPVSMPIQLPSFSTPPPDYSSASIYGRRLDKCRSMIFPREEEGKEELPSYSCTVYKMGYVNVKKELDSPDNNHH